MKNLVKVLCLVLALVMMISFCACDTTPAESSAPADESKADESTPADESKEEDSRDPYLDSLLPTEGEEVADLDEYTIESRTVYKAQLGDFYKAYVAACEETNVSKRYALMAIAEAKLMEEAVMFPTRTRGGNYAIGRVAPYSAPSVMWGNDSDRYHQIIATNELMKPADRNEMKAKYGELKGTGTYDAWAKEFLTGKGYTLTDVYSIGFSSDPKTWDALNTSRSADSEAIVNTYDGLVEYDPEGTLQPALAESWTISDDGLTYTFNIRKNAVWVDSQGRKVDDVKADDFVAGMQHMLDGEGGLSWLIDGKVVGVSEYLAGTGEFKDVGVKADGDKVIYTLVEPCSYFMTMLTYNLFAPMSRSFYESKGGKFGEAYDASADGYTYGTNPDNIAYCGPYLVSNFTSENTIVFSANENYWNKDNINIHTINWYFNDGKDALKSYNDMKAGILTSAGLNASAVEQAKTDGLYDEYSYISGTDSTSFMGFLNLNRAAYDNTTTDNSLKSPKNDEQKARDAKAFANVHFRRALCMSIDRGAYNAQSVGEELKLVSLRNSYVPGVFAALEEDITVAINGKDTKFAKGTFYGVIEQAQLDADGSALKVWDPNGDNGVGSGDGFDGWYNVEAAKAELKIAIEELAKAGVEVSKDKPIYVDYPWFDASTTYKNQGNVLKQSIEAALDGCVIVNLNSADQDQWYDCGYYTEYGKEANYDVYDVSGWGPDYGDPSTYLDTFLPEFAGYMIRCIGIY